MSAIREMIDEARALDEAATKDGHFWLVLRDTTNEFRLVAGTFTKKAEADALMLRAFENTGRNYAVREYAPASEAGELRRLVPKLVEAVEAMSAVVTVARVLADRVKHSGCPCCGEVLRHWDECDLAAALSRLAAISSPDGKEKT